MEFIFTDFAGSDEVHPERAGDGAPGQVQNNRREKEVRTKKGNALRSSGEFQSLVFHYHYIFKASSTLLGRPVMFVS